jgi:hypothetical protein
MEIPSLKNGIRGRNLLSFLVIICKIFRHEILYQKQINASSLYDIIRQFTIVDLQIIKKKSGPEFRLSETPNQLVYFKL